MVKKAETIKFSLIEREEHNAKALVESQTSGRKYVNYGEDNDFPEYLWQLYLHSAILSSIIDGSANYIAGSGVINNLPIKFQEKINNDYETIEDLCMQLAFDYQLFGGFAIQLIYNKLGEINELYHLDIRKLRVNEDENTAYYCEKWGKYNANVLEMPIYDPSVKQESCVFYFKGHRTRGVYPIPRYIGSLNQIETECEIGKYHLSNILNNLDSGVIVNFNNGVPSQAVQKEIERKLHDKFGGASNAGKTMVTFNETKDNAVTLEKLGDDGKDKKFETLYQNVMKEIFVSMQATPTLFGLQVENNGFSKEEFLQAFELYNKTIISPLQKDIQRCFSKIFKTKDVVILKPFVLEDTENKELV